MSSLEKADFIEGQLTYNKPDLLEKDSVEIFFQQIGKLSATYKDWLQYHHISFVMILSSQLYKNKVNITANH